jgi:hypothetical protein
MRMVGILVPQLVLAQAQQEVVEAVVQYELSLQQ